MENEFIVVQHSRWSVKETMDRVQEALEKKSATIYTRIDQQAEAQKAGIQTTALEFLLFGNPAAGGHLMAANPLVALDLPLKLIAWQNEQGDTMVAFNDPALLSTRYGIAPQQLEKLNLKPLLTALL